MSGIRRFDFLNRSRFASISNNGKVWTWGVINLGREGGKTCSRLFDGTVDGLLLPRGFFLRYVRVSMSCTIVETIDSFA